MSVASITLLAISGVLTLMGLVPCLGCLNYAGIPIALATAVVGVVGLASDRDPKSREPLNQGLHLLALVGGIGLMILGGVRLILGAGVV